MNIQDWAAILATLKDILNYIKSIYRWISRKFGRNRIEALIADLRSQDISQREQAKQKLIENGKKSIKPCIEVMKKMETYDSEVATHAAIVLGKIGKYSIRHLINEYIKNESSEEEIDLEMIKNAFREMEGEEVKTEFSLLISTKTDWQRRKVAIIGASESKEASRLISDFVKVAEQASQITLRLQSIHAMSKMEDVNATNCLIRLLEDNQPKVRIASAKALSTIGDASPRVVLALQKCAETNYAKDFKTAEQAILSLGDLGTDSEVCNFLADLLGTTKVHVRIRKACINALAKIDCPNAINEIRNILSSTSEDVEVKKTCIETLNTFSKREECKKILGKASSDEMQSERIRNLAIKALANMIPRED